MSSVREQILDAVVTAWNTSRPGGVPELVRAPFREIQLTDITPQDASVYWVTDEEKPDTEDTGPVQVHELLFGIELRAVGNDSQSPETLLDPSAVWAASALNDNRLGGLALFLRVAGSQMDRDNNHHRPLGKLLVGMRCKYISAVNDFESN